MNVAFAVVPTTRVRLETTRGTKVGGLRTPFDEADATEAGQEVSGSVIAAARRGDHQAFNTLVTHYDGRLRVLAYHLLQDPEAMRDALQDSYVKAYVGLPGFRGESELGTWLHRIVYTTCLNHLRSRARHPLPAGEGPSARDRRDEAGCDPADAVASALDLDALLRSLPIEQRAAVVLVDALGIGYQQTGEILGVPQGTVASRVTSARVKLRRALVASGDPSVPEHGNEAS